MSVYGSVFGASRDVQVTRLKFRSGTKQWVSYLALSSDRLATSLVTDSNVFIEICGKDGLYGTIAVDTGLVVLEDVDMFNKIPRKIMIDKLYKLIITLILININ